MQLWLVGNLKAVCREMVLMQRKDPTYVNISKVINTFIKLTFQQASFPVEGVTVVVTRDGWGWGHQMVQDTLMSFNSSLLPCLGGDLKLFPLMKVC